MIGEIIVVDNNNSERPNRSVLSNPKIKILNFNRNTFVNEAWNKGVEAAKYDKLCFCKDDIIFDSRVFNRTYDHITPELGVMGVSVAPWQEYITDGIINIKNYEAGDGQWGFSLCFFMHKSRYEPVPEQLKLFFGDNFVFDNCLWRNLPIKVIKNIWFYTPNSVTISQLDSEFLRKINVEEALEYKKILIQKGIDPYHWSPSIKTILEKFAPEHL
jgi:glycosyltransferase involved in cell wall biosynthesis